MDPRLVSDLIGSFVLLIGRAIKFNFHVFIIHHSIHKACFKFGWDLVAFWMNYLRMNNADWMIYAKIAQYKTSSLSVMHGEICMNTHGHYTQIIQKITKTSYKVESIVNYVCNLQFEDQLSVVELEECSPR